MLKTRSTQKELLDNDEIPAEDLCQNLKELEIINTYLGGHNISLKGIDICVKEMDKSHISILDIGCGGGDNLRAIEHHFLFSKNIRLIGSDLKQDCIDYALRKNESNSIIEYRCCDFREQIDKGIDIVHASLFFHHFGKKEIVEYLKKVTSQGCYMVINDLERNPIAYYAILWLTRLFSKSYLVKNDAPLSVARGFRRKDWEDIFKSCGIKRFKIYNKWAFRHLIIIPPYADQ